MQASLSPFSVAQSPRTPEISLDPVSGIFEINGRSIPEDAISFYKPIIDWVKRYAENPPQNTVINVKLDFCNTSSSKYLIDMFKKIDEVRAENKGEVIINWHYDKHDEETYETGEDFRVLVETPFNFIPYLREN